MKHRRYMLTWYFTVGFAGCLTLACSLLIPSQVFCGLAKSRSPAQLNRHQLRATEPSDLDLQILANRIKEIQSGKARMPLMVFDSMVPGQQMELWTDDVTFCALVAAVGAGGLIGMLGLEPRTRKVLRRGCTVAIRSCFPRDGGLYVVLESEKPLIRLPSGTTPTSIGRWRRGYSEQPNGIALGWGPETFVEEFPELTESTQSVSTDIGVKGNIGDGAWHIELVERIPEEVELQEDHPEILRIQPLIDQWMALVREKKRERQEGQLELILQNLGPKPPATLPWAFALWLAGLINPLPALGVALEIRPAVLSARTLDEALDAVFFGLRHSIKNMSEMQ